MMLRPLCLAVLLAAACSRPTLACTDLPAADASALTLGQALDRVASCHPDVRAARGALGGAAADVQVAGQAPNPLLTLGAGSVGRSLGSGSPWGKTFDHALRLDQLIERGGKPTLRRAAAEAARAAASADVADARRRALSSVAHAHQDLWAAQGRRSQLAAATQLSSESLRVIDQRVRAGDAPALDATRLRLDDARVRADLRQAEADVAELQQQLALQIGAAGVAGQLQAVAVDLAAWPLPGVDAAADRPDVAAARARVHAAERLRDLAVAGRTRDVTVGLQFDHWPTSAANSSGTGNTVSVSVSLPLFVRHANDGELARAEADLSAARDALQRTEATASSELLRVRALAGAAQDRRRLVVEQLEPAAEQVAAGAELAYRRGASSALELLDARRSLRAVRIERVAADAELAKALADWQAAATPLVALAP